MDVLQNTLSPGKQSPGLLGAVVDSQLTGVALLPPGCHTSTTTSPSAPRSGREAAAAWAKAASAQRTDVREGLGNGKPLGAAPRPAACLRGRRMSVLLEPDILHNITSFSLHHIRDISDCAWVKHCNSLLVHRCR
jgi:hypothetical protein